MTRNSQYWAVCFVLLTLENSTEALAWDTTANFMSSSLNGVSKGTVTTFSNDSATIAPPSEFTVPFPEDSLAFLGEGFDLIAGQRKPAYCVTLGEAQRTTFNDKTASISQVTDEESLFRKLNRSISASGKYAGYSGGGSYTDSVEVRTSSKEITLVAKADIRAYAMSMKVPRKTYEKEGYPDRRFDLSPDAKGLVSNPAKFREICGDGYTSQIFYGADFYSIFHYKNLHFEQKKTVEITFNASGPGGAFSTNGSQKQEEEIKKDNIEESINVRERGGAPAALANDRESLVEQYKTFATRVEGHERPMFVTVRRYSTLPSFADDENLKGTLALYDNFEALVRRTLRLKSLLNDFNDAIDQLQGGGFRGFFHDARIIDPTGVRSLKGILKEQENLTTELIASQKKIQSCMQDPSLENCSIGDNMLTYVTDTARPSATTSDDLGLRARSLLPSNSVSRAERAGWREFIARGGVTMKFAACAVVRAIERNNVQRIASLRCKTDNECLLDEEVKNYRLHAYDGFLVDPSYCEADKLDPFPPPPTPEKNLGWIRMGRGRSFSITSTSSSDITNTFELKIVCPDLEPVKLSNLTAGSLQSIDFPRFTKNCNLEVRAFHSGNAPNEIADDDIRSDHEAIRLAITSGNDEIDEGRSRYRLRYDDYSRAAGGDADKNDIVVNVTVSEALE